MCCRFSVGTFSSECSRRQMRPEFVHFQEVMQTQSQSSATWPIDTFLELHANGTKGISVVCISAANVATLPPRRNLSVLWPVLLHRGARCRSANKARVRRRSNASVIRYPKLAWSRVWMYSFCNLSDIPPCARTSSGTFCLGLRLRETYPSLHDGLPGRVAVRQWIGGPNCFAVETAWARMECRHGSPSKCCRNLYEQAICVP